MPGILPMKVIKVGTSAQSRIAQACDRCRSKKIRCDGVRPTCSQCANVGFECKTSDKLSRRAFPRGYTESLEERVRALETEVRELKDLLDEKDEKIDMLSKMHGGHHYGRPAASNSPKSSAGSPESRKEPTPVKEDTFRVQASPLLLGVENSDSFFMGGSSGRPFIEAFKRKIQESGKQGSDFNPDAFLHTQGTPPLSTQPPDSSLRIPPRMYADRCVNVYFQEWAPLFPVLHKPTFLGIYADFFADHDKIKSNHKIAQLYLVFSIAGLSSESPDIPQLVACEQQWTKALESVLLEDTMSTLQCLILALMYCAMRADYKRVQHYKSIAVGLSHRLGLHQSQKRFSFGALTIETRKKVFWTLYTLDCFTAATLGLPKLLKEADVQTEYPSDADDEYVTEKGFQPTLPGESTRLSSALALFRATRVLARVLEKNYPATSSYELSLQQMESLEVELDEWYGDLPSHLRLKFVQDKPSTDVTSSRSPLLAMTYYYIRTLIYRPAIGSTLGSKAAPALMSISDSSKHIVQIVELLEERGMNFSFCLNKGDLLTLCGMTLLYRSVGLKAESKLMKDDGRLINSVFKTLLRNQVPGTYEFQRIASKLIAMDQPSVSPSISEQALPTPTNRASPTAQQRKKSTSSLSQQSMRHPSETETIRQGKTGRLSMNDMDEQQRAQFYRSHSRHSFDSVQDSSVSPMSQVPCNSRQHSSGSRSKQNLDYLSLSNTPLQSRSGSPPHNRNMPLTANRADQTMTPMPMGKMAGPVTNAEWEAILGSMDGGLNNVYDAIYGGSAFINEAPLPSKNDWSPDTWDLANFNINEFGQAPVPPQSVLSLSDESLSSGEEVSPSDLNLGMGNIEYSDSNGFIIENFEGFPL